MAETTSKTTQQEKKRKPGTFQPGQSGNPGGRNKTPKDVREAFKAASKDAVEYLVALVKDKSRGDTYRIKAAEIILDRGYGKPIQMPEEVLPDSVSPLKVQFDEVPDALTDPAKQDNLELPE